MCLAHPHAPAALHIPPAQIAVTAAADKHILARTPGHRRDDPRWFCKGTYMLPALDIPDEQFPSLSATTSRSESCASRAPGHARNHTVMSRQPLQSACRQRHPTHTPCHHHPRQPAVCRPDSRPRADRSLEQRVVPAMAGRCHIEHFCPKPIRTGGQPLTIRTPRQSEEAVTAIVGVFRVPGDRYRDVDFR